MDGSAACVTTASCRLRRWSICSSIPSALAIPARRLVLGQLARHDHRPFADWWDFVDYVHQEKLPLDLSMSPARSRILP
jgi:hypothetical protein